MAFRTGIVERGSDVYTDEDCRYKWNWGWVDRDVEVEEDGKKKTYRCSWVRKLRTAGTAYCTLCRKELKYASKGFDALAKHAATALLKRKEPEPETESASFSSPKKKKQATLKFFL